MKKLILLLLATSLYLPCPLFAQSNQTFNVQTSSYVQLQEVLQKKINKLNANHDIDEEQKKKIQGIYERTDENIRNLEWFDFKSRLFQQELTEAAEKLHKLKLQIKSLEKQSKRQAHDGLQRLTIIELELRLSAVKSQLIQISDKTRKLESNIADHKGRIDLVRQELYEVHQTLSTIPEEALIENPTDTAKEALELYRKTRMDAGNARITMLENELNTNPQRLELLSAELKLGNLQKKQLLKEIKALENKITELQQSELEHSLEAVALAELDASGKHNLIRQLIQSNYRYNKLLQQVFEKTIFYENEKENLVLLGEQIEKDFKSAEKKINLAGLSPALGRILREQRRKLVNTRDYDNKLHVVQDEIAFISLEQLNIEERLKQIADTQSELKILLQSEIDPSLPSEQRAAIALEMETLLDDQKALLDRLDSDLTDYLRKLGDYEFQIRQFLSSSALYAAYLNEHLLWVKSSSPFAMGTLKQLAMSLRWLLAPNNWLSVTKHLKQSSQQHSLKLAICLVVLLVLILSTKKIKQNLEQMSEKVIGIYSDAFHFTIRAILSDLILALRLPLLLFCTGWLASIDAQSGSFSYAFGKGLIFITFPLLFLQFLFISFKANNIFELHFNWSDTANRIMRRNIRLVRLFALPAMFLTSMTGYSNNTLYHDSLGRSGLLVALLVMAFVLGSIFHPQGPLFRNITTNTLHPWIAKLNYILHALVISIPLLIAGFAMAGYYLSALELQQKLILTFRLIFLLLFIDQLIMRWLTLVNRKLAVHNARKRRKTTKLGGQQIAHHNDDNLVNDEQPLLDIPKINAQTEIIINTLISFSVLLGLGLIWKDMFPAFSFLDDIVLWRQSILLDNQQLVRNTTLMNLCFAFLYLFIAIITVKNLTGVMEVLVFRHFSMDQGSQFATRQLTQYSIIALGIILIANELGASWSQVQWLVAALSVGLGFGLQEIFANMVSGIILLFERPMRIGDTVTIGDISGNVSKIQMRATTITDWDQKELIVPNKNFITGQLINWSLSDSITRVVIPLGIAYGSDVARAHQIILETVKSTKYVLADPKPVVLFLGFGDSSLEFSIRLYVAELGHRLKVTHKLHMRINEVLNKNGIVIPFPQRDIHVNYA